MEIFVHIWNDIKSGLGCCSVGFYGCMLLFPGIFVQWFSYFNCTDYSRYIKVSGHYLLQVNLCQKLLFLHQLTSNMTTDCSLNYKFNTWKFQAQNTGRTCCVQKLFLTFRTISVHNMFSPCSAKRRASDKDLPLSCRSSQTQASETFQSYEKSAYPISSGNWGADWRWCLK